MRRKSHTIRSGTLPAQKRKLQLWLLLAVNKYLKHMLLRHWMCNVPFEQHNQHTHKLFVHLLRRPLAHGPCHDLSVSFSLVWQVYYVRLRPQWVSSIDLKISMLTKKMKWCRVACTSIRWEESIARKEAPDGPSTKEMDRSQCGFQCAPVFCPASIIWYWSTRVGIIRCQPGPMQAM